MCMFFFVPSSCPCTLALDDVASRHPRHRRRRRRRGRPLGVVLVNRFRPAAAAAADRRLVAGFERGETEREG